MSIRRIALLSLLLAGCVEQVEPIGLRGCVAETDCAGGRSCVVGHCVVNHAPRAEAGADLVADVGSLVTLDGSQTADVNGDRLTYRWVQVGGASGVEIAASDAAVATFVAPVTSGDLAFELRVSDGAAGAEAATDQVVVTVTNKAPTAEGGAGVIGALPADPADGQGPLGGGVDADEDPGDIELFTTAEVDAGEHIVLSGEASTDPEGLPLSYRWTQIAGEPVELDGADTVVASFAAPAIKGGLAFELTVGDGEHTSAPLPVQVIVLNQDPVALIDGGGRAEPAAVVTLDGSGSFDPDGDPVSFRWEQLDGPVVRLEKADDDGGTGSVVRFAAPVGRAELSFRLGVDDDDGGRGVALVSVTVANTPPVAVVTPDVIAADAGAMIRLEAGESHDVDGDPLTYSWRQVEGPPVVLIGDDGPRPQLQTPAERSTVVFALVVHDGHVASAPARALITVANQRPVATIAGPADRTVEPGAAVVLDAAPSHDPDGDPLSFGWRQTGGPAVALTGADTATAGFEAPIERAALSFELQVRDGAADSEPATVRVHVANQAPVADAGPDFQAPQDRTVQLDGTRSADPDGDALTYRWRQLSGDPVLLSDATAGLPKFETPARRQALEFELTVSDGMADSAPDVVTVHIGNSPPVAQAGPAQRDVAQGGLVTLDGSASADADGDALTFAWRQIAGPVAALSDAAAVRPTFTAPDRRRSLEFELIVRDDLAASAPSRVVISTANTAPIAQAGEDQRADGGDEITLDASDSSDADGDALRFLWEQLEGEPVGLQDGDTATTSFTAPIARDELTFRVTVGDGIDERSDTVTVFVRNHAPVADAGPGQVVDAGAEVTLDGRGSSDLDGDELTYDWVQTGGEAVELQGADTAQPTFATFDRRGVYSFELTVSDGTLDSEPDAVEVSVDNRRPVADAGDDRLNVRGGVAIRLDGRRSADADGDALTYAWEQVAGPDVILDDPSVPQPRFTTPRPRSELRFSLIVDDGLQASEPDQVTVRTENNPPAADAGDDQVVQGGERVALDATASTDLDGDELACIWDQRGGPAVIIESPAGCTASFVAPAGRSAMRFRVTVSDGHGGQRTDETVVSVANSRPVADAGDDQQVDPGQLTVLDGRGSADADGDGLTYDWRQDGGQPVDLVDRNTARPRFVAPATRGRVSFVLVVNDGVVDSEPDRVDVDVRNAPPVADAGEDRQVERGAEVTLDGTGSHDPEDDELTFSWLQLDGPPVNLDGADTAQPSFRAPALRAAMRFSLTVHDGAVDSEPDVVLIRTPNTAPVADAGEDQQIDGGEAVTLDATGSSDADGDALTYEWEQRAGDGVQLSDATAARPTFLAPIPRQDLVFRVRVRDAHEASEWDEVTVSIRNHAPVADAGDDDSVVGGHEYRLDGRGSSDLDGDDLTYAWTAPGGVALDDATAERPRFTAPVPRQDLRFQLRVTDELGATSALDEVVISVPNNPPVADGGPDRLTAVEQRVELDGGASTDADGDALTYRWRQTAGERVDIDEKEGGRVIAFETPGDPDELRFELTVTDPLGATDTDVVRIHNGAIGDLND